MPGKRSPRYPAISLGDAIGRAKALYNKDGAAPVSPETAVAAWDYSSLHGTAARNLAALRHYGLLDDVGDDVKLSERALAIILEPESHPEHADALHNALREPDVLRETLEEYEGYGLPSTEGLVSFLVRKKGFTDSAAKKFNEIIRESVALVEDRTGAQSGDYNGETSEDERVEGDARTQGRGSASMTRPGATTGGREMVYSMPLSKDATAIIEIRGDVGRQEVSFLESFLDLVKKSVKASAEKGSTEEEAVNEREGGQEEAGPSTGETESSA